MNKTVYLFELDSVRTSAGEITLGQQALYDELVIRGNTVALAFHQLADSPILLSSLKKEKQLDAILGLFRLGRLKISLYGRYRTATQYILTAVEKCIGNLDKAEKAARENGTTVDEELQKKDLHFVFSAWPIQGTDRRLMERIADTLRYNDLNLIKELLSEARADGDSADRIEALETVLACIRLIISLDMYEIPYIPAAIKQGPTLSQYLDSVLTYYLIEKHPLGARFSKTDAERFRSALTMLHGMRHTLASEAGDVNSRSDWYTRLDRAQCEPSLRSMAKMIVDLCLNYTVEENIRGIARRFTKLGTKSFRADFEKRLADYVKTHENADGARPRLIGWHAVLRFLSPANRTSASVTSEKSVYSSDRARQYLALVGKTLFRCLSITAYTLIAFLITVLLDAVEALELIRPSGYFLFDLNVLWILFFGVISSAIEKLPIIHDLADSLFDLLKLISDWFRYFRYLIISFQRDR
ncbi:MAG: hypothetical protein IJV98_01225 [Clostridia bacterium]|nr:hypothetical protein [Clostridia bacterium]